MLQVLSSKNKPSKRTVVQAAISDGMSNEGFSEEMTFEQRPEWSKGARQANAYGKNIPEGVLRMANSLT